MAARNWPACFRATLKHEGGWSDHARDPGGATMKGVTLRTYRAYKPGASKTDLRNISDEMLSRIYREGYWEKVRGDDLPSGVDYATYDAAVNSGPSRAAKWLQRAVVADADGVVGPKTIEAVQKVDPRTIVNRMCDDRMNFLRGLGTWGTFGKGWTRRVEGVRREALRMASDVAKPAPQPEPTPAEPKSKPLDRKVIGGLIGAIAAAVAALAAYFTGG